MIEAKVADIGLRFETLPGVFSPTRLDPGSLAMLSCIRFEPRDKILDLGCGYGLVGIYAAKVIGPSGVCMIDKDRAAVESASKNLTLNGVEGVTLLVSDGFRQIRETNFTKIVCNPPYHGIFQFRSTSSRRGSIDLFCMALCTSLPSGKPGTKRNCAAYSAVFTSASWTRTLSSKR
jgi:16S rRNA (guanine1207-N2)-methyltransferase